MPSRALTSALLCLAWLCPGTGERRASRPHAASRWKGLALASVATPEPATAAILDVALRPDLPGASTTLRFGFRISTPRTGLPSPLRKLVVRLPPGVAVDTAGLASCGAAKQLEAHGAGACTRNAEVGSGYVDVLMPLGEEVQRERAQLTVFNGAPRGRRATLLFLAVGRLPIATRQVFGAVIRPSPAGTEIEASIPAIPSLPNSPDGAIVSMSASLGTLSHPYYRMEGSRRIPLHPRGVTLPSSCPSGHLSFAAEFAFQDGGRDSASRDIACGG